MIKNTLLILFLSLVFIACKDEKTKDQSTEYSQPIAKTKKETTSISKTNTINDFIPENHFILDSTSNSQFVVLVTASIKEKNDQLDAELPRMCIVLEKVPNGFKQMANNDNLILCKICGGIFGDPFAGIELNDNVLKISNYGGSAWRWSENYIFRYRNDHWNLIGATYDSYYNAADCDGNAGQAGRQLEDINFAAGKMQIIHTNDAECEPFEDYMEKFEKKKPIYLPEFPGSPNQWPNGKIKDGDGND